MDTMSLESGAQNASKMDDLANSAAAEAVPTSGPVKLSTPLSEQGFPLFSLLPPELRFQIWDEAMTTPGMHFLRLEEAVDEDDRSAHGSRDRRSSRANPDEALILGQSQAAEPTAGDSAPDATSGTTTVAAPGIATTTAPVPVGEGSSSESATSVAEVPTELDAASPAASTTSSASTAAKDPKKAVYRGRLAPLFPLLQADTSYYVTLAKTLAQLACSCNEGQRVVSRALEKPTALRFAPSNASPSTKPTPIYSSSGSKPAVPAAPEPPSLSGTPFMGHEIGAGQGRLISLHPELDVVCIKYLNDIDYACETSVLPWHRPWQQPNAAGSDGTVTKTTKRELECAELAGVRRLAVGYCRAWDARRFCQNCGFSHHIRRQRYPHHLLEFLDEFPNLEALYFIDDSIQRRGANAEQSNRTTGGPACPRPSSSAGAGATPAVLDASSAASSPLPSTPTPTTSGSRTSQGGRLPYFQGGGKTYYDITDAPADDWVVESNVRLTMAWMQGEFVKPGSTDSFAEDFLDAKNTSPPKARRHPNPTKVQFRVLACEFRSENPPVPVSRLRSSENLSKVPRTAAFPGPKSAGKKTQDRFGSSHKMTAGEVQLRDYVSRKRAAEHMPLRRWPWDTVVVRPARTQPVPVVFGGGSDGDEGRANFEFGFTFAEDKL